MDTRKKQMGIHSRPYIRLMLFLLWIVFVSADDVKQSAASLSSPSRSPPMEVAAAISNTSNAATTASTIESTPQPTLRLANTLGSHMVLQQAPRSACLWGKALPSSIIAVSINMILDKEVVTDANGDWIACLQPHKAGGPFQIEIDGSGEKIIVEDVLFGEVWLCSGQSNMQFSLAQALNNTLEVAATVHYPTIRVMAIGLNTSLDPLEDIESPMLPWSVASPQTVGGPEWNYFSAACWFYGVNLEAGLKVPVGLIQSAYGSTQLMAWSTPDALATCAANASIAATRGDRIPDSASPVAVSRQEAPPQIENTNQSAVAISGKRLHGYLVPLPPPSRGGKDDTASTPKHNNRIRRRTLREGRILQGQPAIEQEENIAEAMKLNGYYKPKGFYPQASWCYNAMIHPILQMTFRGVVWDQGEQDVYHPGDYRCLFPVFIRDWRSRFVQSNLLSNMAFGFVQLQGYNDAFMMIQDNGIEVGRLRLAQYSGLQEPDTFMIVTYDLNDPTSPYQPVHFRDKQDVGLRLAHASLHDVYSQLGAVPFGPTARTINSYLDNDGETLRVLISFEGAGTGLVYGGASLFELAITEDAVEAIPAKTVKLVGRESVVVDFDLTTQGAITQVSTHVLRHAYRNNPCPLRKEETPYVSMFCGLYSSEGLPALPFIQLL